MVFTHTVTNTGITADTYTVIPTNALLWPMRVIPSEISLAPGASQVVTVAIDIPNDNSNVAGSKNYGLVRVVSDKHPTESHAEATEEITVGKVTALLFTADQARAVTPNSGTIYMRDLVLSNIGNAADTVDFTVLGANGGWSVNIIPSELARPARHRLQRKRGGDSAAECGARPGEGDHHPGALALQPERAGRGSPALRVHRAGGEDHLPDIPAGHQEIRREELAWRVTSW